MLSSSEVLVRVSGIARDNEADETMQTAPDQVSLGAHKVPEDL
jgi:hypothetical protein